MTFGLDVWLVVAEKLKINKVREMQGQNEVGLVGLEHHAGSVFNENVN